MSQGDAVDDEARDVVALARTARAPRRAHRRRERAFRRPSSPARGSSAPAAARTGRAAARGSSCARAAGERLIGAASASAYTLMPLPRRATRSLPRKCSASSTRVVAAESLPQPFVVVWRPSTARSRGCVSPCTRDRGRARATQAADARARRESAAHALRGCRSRARFRRHDAVDVQVVLDQRRASGTRGRGRRPGSPSTRWRRIEVGRARRRADRDRAARSRMRANASAIDAAQRRSERATRVDREGSRSAQRIDDRQARGARRGQESADEAHRPARTRATRRRCRA